MTHYIIIYLYIYTIRIHTGRPLQTLTEASCHGDIAHEVRNLEINVLEA
jgi:hypothetical protein